MAPFRPCISKTNSTLIDNAEQEAYAIIMKTKLMMLMIMLQMATCLNIKQKKIWNTSERSGNEGGANQPPMPTLNVEVTIPVKYLGYLLICHW